MRQIALVFALLFAFSLNLHAQTARNPPLTPPPSDAQAVATVQAAITALGGATAITQAQSWIFQASLSGPVSSGAWSEGITRSSSPPAAATGATSNSNPAATGATVKPSHPRTITSLLVPSLVGAVLVQESQDPYWIMHYRGKTSLNTENVTEIIFSHARTALPEAQTWYFDSSTGLPARIAFKIAAQIGLKKSPLGLASLSNYQSVSGVLHPFQIVMFIPGASRPEVIAFKSISGNAVTSASTSSTTGGVQ